MPLRLYQVVLPVSDIDQAEKFYSHLLGTPGRRTSPGQHHFECGGVILICNDLSAEEDSSQTSSSPHRLRKDNLVETHEEDLRRLICP